MDTKVHTDRDICIVVFISIACAPILIVNIRSKNLLTKHVFVCMCMYVCVCPLTYYRNEYIYTYMYKYMYMHMCIYM